MYVARLDGAGTHALRLRAVAANPLMTADVGPAPARCGRVERPGGTRRASNRALRETLLSLMTAANAASMPPKSLISFVGAPEGIRTHDLCF